MRSNRLSILAFPLVVLLLAPGACLAAEPQAAFVLKKGWVTLTLTRAGVPVSDAKIEVFDGRGQQFASGETDPAGRGEFPLPPGSSFLVAIEVGDRTADAIRLTREGDGLFPAEVLLSFGLAPCCRIPARGWSVDAQARPATDSPTDSSPNWLLAASVVGLAFFGSVATFLILFPGRNKTQ